MYPIDEKLELIGNGGFGVVYPGTWENEKGVQIKVAVKRVQLTDIKENDRHEELCLKKLNHIQVVKLFDVSQDDNFRYFILELCDGSLDHVFLPSDNPKKYKGPKLPHHFNVLFQLAIGLEYIHSNNLIHRDVKPANVLISVDAITKTVTLKWADFGLSRPVSERGTYQITELKGTNKWLAPELLQQLDDFERTGVHEKQILLKGTVKSDIFALGLVFGYYLKNGNHPYVSEDAAIETNLKTRNPTDVIKLKPMHSYLEGVIVRMLAKEESRINSSDVVHQLIAESIEIKKKFKVNEKKLVYLCADGKKTKLEKIRVLIESGVDINTVDSDGLTPLLLIANRTAENPKESQRKFLYEVIKLFTENDELDVNCKQQDGSTALHVLCKHFQNNQLIDIVRLLIERGIDVNQTTSSPISALNISSCWCDHHGNVVNLVKPLDSKNSANCSYGVNNNALLVLCQYYHGTNLLQIVKLFIDSRININHCNNERCNALLTLCRYYERENLFEIVKLLIESGINVNQTNNNGNNALNFLVANYSNENLIEIIKLLIYNKINLNCINNDCNNALLLLCQFYRSNNLLEIVKLLIKNKINVNHSNREGSNALFILCRNYSGKDLIDIVKLLINSRIDVHHTNNDGWNALLILCSSNIQQENLFHLVELLLDNGIDVYCTHEPRHNALDILSKFCKQNPCFERTRELLIRKININ